MQLDAFRVIMNALRAAIRNACCVYNKLPNAATSVASGDGIRYFCTRAANTIFIRPRLPDGAPVAYITMEDVCLSVTDTNNASPIYVHTQIQLDSGSGNISIAYTLDVDTSSMVKEICVHVHVCGVLLVNTRATRKPFDGRTGGRLHIQHAFSGVNMAIHPAGTHLAACVPIVGKGKQSQLTSVNVFTLPEFQFVNILGGEIEYCGPHGLCFTDNGTLLIADFYNKRVQHWALDGEWIASYPVRSPRYVASRGDAVVVGCHENGVYVFSLKSGTKISEWLLNKGWISTISAITFVDADTLAVADSRTEIMGLYTLRGVLKTQLATNVFSSGLAVCADGCLLASDYGQKRIRVFLPTGDELKTSPLSTFLFEDSSPCDIALHAGHAYVFERIGCGLTRICVFE